MNSSTRTRAAAALLVAVAVLPSLASAADELKPPAALNISEVAQKGTLLRIHKDQIREHLEYHAEMMRRADTQKEIDAARDGLIGVYEFSKHASYQYTAAQLVAEVATPLLKLKKPIKQVNVALALSMMPQASIQPALEEMILHPNTAVRYLGWKGYQTAWAAIILQGAPTARKMLESLERGTRSEPSPEVLTQIWEIFRFRGQVPSLPQGIKPLDETGADIINRNYIPHIWAIRAGDVEMADTGLTILGTCVEYAATATVTKKKKIAAQAMQVIVDLMWCSATAYAEAEETGPRGKAVMEANALLLLECERRLNRFLGLGALQQQNYLGTPLSSKEFEGKRGDMLIYHMDTKSGRKYGVSVWVEYLKEKGYALTAPSAERLGPPPASQPDDETETEAEAATEAETEAATAPEK